jgi:hypothetical protein
VLSIPCFAALIVGRSEAKINALVYYGKQGLHVNPSLKGMLIEYIGGCLLAVAVIVVCVLMMLGARMMWPLIPVGVLMTAMLLGLVQIMDGINNLNPDEDDRAIWPSWFFPLNLVQGLITAATYGLAIVLLLNRRSLAYFDSPRPASSPFAQAQ